MEPMERRTRTGLGRLLVVLLAVVLWPGHGTMLAQAVIDLCGCAGDPTLQPFDADDPNTYPPGTTGGCSPGTTCNSGTINLPLPPDGVLKFSSFVVDGGFNVGFIRNATNTPVTLLVSGDVRLRGAFGCCQSFSVSGGAGSHGTSQSPGVGGLGGNGGLRGGDGAAEAINGLTIGGAGFGPGGGTGATPGALAGGGTFFGVPELVPLVGGSGGGGGTSINASSPTCTGGGGGGGGGALLIAANGTFTLENMQLFADGGSGGSVGNGNCARGGGGGAAGAIRLIAGRFLGGGVAQVFARGGGVSFNANGGSNGRIRLESVDPSAQTAFFTEPAAFRVTGPGPVSNPVSPLVRITSVGGNTIPAVPAGWTGAIDVNLPAPGVTTVDVETSGVPSGTTLLVTAKPRIGALPVSSTVPLSDCDAQGVCQATATFNLAAGAYTVEARATFQVQ